MWLESPPRFNHIIALVKIYHAEFTIGKRRNFHAVIPPKTLTTLPNPVLVIMLEAISRDSVDRPVLWNRRNIAGKSAQLVEARKFTDPIGGESWNGTSCAPCKSGPIAASLVTTGSTAGKQRSHKSLGELSDVK